MSSALVKDDSERKCIIQACWLGSHCMVTLDVPKAAFKKKKARVLQAGESTGGAPSLWQGNVICRVVFVPLRLDCKVKKWL